MLTEKRKWLVAAVLVAAFLVYSSFLYISLPFKQSARDPLAAKGKLLWQKNNCVACHQIYGLGGYLGPDLTNVFSKRGPDYIKVFLKAGTPIMPRFNLSAKEMDALVAFLKEVDATGSSDPRTFSIQLNGTIEQK